VQIHFEVCHCSRKASSCLPDLDAYHCSSYSRTPTRKEADSLQAWKARRSLLLLQEVKSTTPAGIFNNISPVYRAPLIQINPDQYLDTNPLSVNGCLPKWTDLDWTPNEMWIRIWIRIRIQIQISCIYTTLSRLNPDKDLDQVVPCKHGYSGYWSCSPIYWIYVWLMGKGYGYG